MGFFWNQSMKLSNDQSNASRVSSLKSLICNSEYDTPAADTVPPAGMAYELTTNEVNIVFGLGDYCQNSP